MQFDWSNGNEEKITAREGITTALVEAAFNYSKALLAADPTVEEPRYQLRSVVEAGGRLRPVFIVFTQRAGRIRPISARFMNARERKKYDPEIGYSPEVHKRGG